MAANISIPIRIPRIIPSVGNPGIGGSVKEVEYDATYVPGALTTNGASIVPPVAFFHPANW